MALGNLCFWPAQNRCKICGLYILEGSNVVVHSSSPNEDFHEKNTLWDLRSSHGGCLGVVLEHFNEFCRGQRVNTHFTIELSLSLWGKVGAKAAYLVDRCSFIIINFSDTYGSF